MQIKDITANKGNIDIIAKVIALEQPRSFNKFGKEGKVCNAKLQDESGEIKLTLWNEDISTINLGDTVHIDNGWCSEYKGEKQLSTGKLGKIEVVEKSQIPPTVFTNDEQMLKSSKKMQKGGDDDEDGDGDSSDEGTEEEQASVDEEEYIE